MKKVLGTILTGAILIACGEGKHTPIATPASATASTTTTVAATTTSTVAPAAEEKKEDFSKGMTLIANSDCLTCHKLNEKVIGPAYKEVAKKYAYTPANVKMLAGKIIKGGAGNWGPIPMTAHAALSQADAESMVKYILNLKK
jgi:cytochrome c